MPRRIQLPDGTQHEFPDDATDQEIAEALEAPPSTARTTPEGKTRSWTDLAVSLLPTAGGALGGIVGGIGGTVGGVGVGGVPGAIGGATIGGAAGESAKQLINRARGKEAPTSPLDAATEIGKEGAIQGVAEGVGGAVMKGIGKGAKAVYRGYLKPSLAAKNVGKAGEIVETALREGIPVSGGGQAKATNLIGELRQVVDAELQNSPASVDLRQIADKVRAYAQRYNRPGADPADFNAVLAVADRIDGHPSLGSAIQRVTAQTLDVPVAEANQVKRTLQETASASYGTPNASATKQATKVGAREARLAVEGATGGPSGTVASLNARESKLIDVARSVRQAVEREANQSKLYGVKTLASATVGGADYARNGDPVSAIAKGAATRAILSPGNATLASIVAFRLQKQLGIAAATAARLANYVLSESEGEAEQVPQ